MIALPILLASMALHAGAASVVEVRGEVRITATDAAAARAARAGDEVGEKDLVLVPAQGSVTLKLEDGTQTKIDGKAIVAGRRLTGGKKAGFAQLAARSADLVAQELETAGASTAMAVRGDEAEPGDPGETARPRRDVSFLGADGKARRSSEIEVAEFSLEKGDRVEAGRRAQAVLEDAASEREERRRAHRVLALVSLGADDVIAGAAHLDRALADSSAADGRAILDSLRIERARARMLLADDAGAQSDLRIVLEPGGDTPRRMEAHFLLGILSLGAGDTNAAAAEFAMLDRVPALEAAAEEALTASAKKKTKNKKKKK